MCGFIAQLVEHRTGIAEVMGSNPVEALIFFRLLLSNCLNWKIYCDDHTSLTLLLYLLVLSLMGGEVLDQTLGTEGTKPYSFPFPLPSRVYTDKCTK